MQKKKVIMGAVTTALTLAMGTAAYAASSDIFFQERVDIGEGLSLESADPAELPEDVAYQAEIDLDMDGLTVLSLDGTVEFRRLAWVWPRRRRSVRFTVRFSL